MDNPFLKRATEFYRDEEAFLAVISPEPIPYYLGEAGRHGRLYDRLVTIEGTPGSGKTTLARLFEYPTLWALLRNDTLPVHRALTAALQDVHVLRDGRPALAAYRLPLETDYREIWQLPYEPELKLGLMMTLIQARTVLGWVRELTRNNTRVELVSRQDAAAALDMIGGADARALGERARAVERAVYEVIGSLVPPRADRLPAECTGAYRPFDVIEEFVLHDLSGGGTSHVRPLVIMDDAHVLNSDQFKGLKRWLSRRELRVGRWILSRLDVMTPDEHFLATAERSGDVDLPGMNPSREITTIRLQSAVTDRRSQRTNFRRMAKDMASRYLRQMPLFSGRNLTALQDFLATKPVSLAGAKLRQVQEDTAATQRRLGLSDNRAAAHRALVESYLGDNHGEPDVAAYMERILAHRYAKRVPQSTLFRDSDSEPTRPVSADVGVYDAARIQLLQKFDRPFYYGIDDLCDAGSENAEQFLRLAAELVDIAATQLVRGRNATLDATVQHRTLRNSASKFIESWNFPDCSRVRTLTSGIAAECVNVSLEPNAWLGAGANAFGIPQEEFDALPTNNAELARVIHYAVAYNAIHLTPRYSCKGTEWCLLELGGVPILAHGLTLKRGGFIEGTARDLDRMSRSGGRQ